MATSVTSTTSSGPVLSSPGIGSGLDVNSIVEQLDAANRFPIDLLTKQTSTIQTRLSAFGLIKSYTTNIHDAVAKIADPTFWKKTSASSTDSSSVSVAASTSAGVGSYSVEVKQLAAAQSLASGSYGSSTASVGTGSLHIDFGSWDTNKTAFTQNATSTSLDITIASGEDSMTAVAAKINAAGAGVSASIVSDTSGARLVIRSTATGATQALRITATADAPATTGGPTLASLAYDPPNGTTGMVEKSTAKNAKAMLNGLSIESATNTFSDVSSGLSLTVGKVTTEGSPIAITVGFDTATMKSAVGDFVAAYNALNKYISDQTAYDAEKKEASTLLGDSSTLSVQSQLRGAVKAASGASSLFTQLTNLGLETQKDGSLTVNDSKLSAALTDHMSGVVEAFTHVDTVNPGNNGFATSLLKLTTALNGTDGLVTTRSAGMQASIDRNDKQSVVYSARADAQKAALLKQYSNLDVKLNSLTALSNYVNQQVTTWNKSTG